MLQAGPFGAASPNADVMIVMLPHLGILDSWLPVLDELRRRQPSVSMIAAMPDPRRLARAPREDFLTDRCDALMDRVATRIVGERWSCFKSFREAAHYARQHNRRRHLGGPLEAFYRRFPRLASSLDVSAPSAGAVLSDVSLLERSQIDGIRHKSRRASWFSLPHGIDPRLPPLRVGKRRGASGLNITIYASSELEASHYEASCGVPKASIKVVGVPRHDQQWLHSLRESYSSPQCRRRFIFLASRPENKINFPAATKLNLLRGLRSVVERLDCALVVRLHPAETEVDKAIVEEALGKEQMGVRWIYSVEPSIIGAHGALFAISMFSSVAVDMLAIGVPVIELFDFSSRADWQSLVTDPQGSPTSIYRRTRLVLPANGSSDLDAAANAILSNREGVLAELKNAYSRVYADPSGAIDTIVTDIITALGRKR